MSDPLSTFHTLRVIYGPGPGIYRDIKVSDLMEGLTVQDDPILAEARKIVAFECSGYYGGEFKEEDFVVYQLN